MREGRFSFTGHTSEVGALRAVLAELLVAEGWPGQDADDVLLIADELATNAVVHAHTPFDVHCMVDGHVELEVREHDPHHMPLLRETGDGPGGFGLRIVDRLARRWEVEQRPDAKVVRVILDQRSVSPFTV
jgi:anti-sigma regulatory factor (Ser/Thr protein kinase)